MRYLATIAVVASLAGVALLSPSAALAKNCGDKYGNILKSPHTALLVLRVHNVRCPTVIALGRAVLHHLPTNADGFHCVSLNIQAGGGAAKCTAPGDRITEYGFE